LWVEKPFGLPGERDVPQVDILRGVEIAEVLALETLGFNAHAVRADRKVHEPEIAVGIGEGLDHLAAGGEETAGTDDDLLVDRVVHRPGDKLARDVPVVDSRTASGLGLE